MGRVDRYFIFELFQQTSPVQEMGNLLSEDIWRLPTDYEYDHAASKRPWPERQNGLLLYYILSWWFDYAFPIISHLFA